MKRFKNYLTILFSFISIISFSQSLLDSDNDGVIDANDNCPLTWNANQIDTDGDLIGDACDCEPTNANPLGTQTPAVLISTISNDTIYYAYF
jgi:hypothetical protein